MSAEILPLIWCGVVLALATFVLIGRVTDGYDRSLLGAVSSLLLIVLFIAFAAGYPYLLDLLRQHSPKLGSPDMVLLVSAAPALVLAIPVLLVMPLRALFVLVLAYGAIVGQHYLPPLFPSLGSPVLDLVLRAAIAFVIAVPLFLSLFGRAGWAWLIPFAFAVMIAGPATVDYAMALIASPPPPAATGTPGATAPSAAPSAATLHLRAALTVVALMLPAVLAFLALRRRPF